MIFFPGGRRRRTPSPLLETAIETQNEEETEEARKRVIRRMERKSRRLYPNINIRPSKDEDEQKFLKLFSDPGMRSKEEEFILVEMEKLVKANPEIWKQILNEQSNNENMEDFNKIEDEEIFVQSTSDNENSLLLFKISQWYERIKAEYDENVDLLDKLNKRSKHVAEERSNVNEMVSMLVQMHELNISSINE